MRRNLCSHQTKGFAIILSRKRPILMKSDVSPQNMFMCTSFYVLLFHLNMVYSVREAAVVFMAESPVLLKCASAGHTQELRWNIDGDLRNNLRGIQTLIRPRRRKPSTTSSGTRRTNLGGRCYKLPVITLLITAITVGTK